MRVLDFLGVAQLGTGATQVFLADSGQPNAKWEVVLWICNTDTADRTVTIRIGTGTLTAANSLFDGTVMSAGKVYVCGQQGDFSIILKAGWKVEGLSDAASKITVTLFGAAIRD